MTEPAATLATTTFNCPRCDAEVTERFWGPCTSCCQQLKDLAATVGSEAEGFEASRFEPSMHVTPNHVATKD